MSADDWAVSYTSLSADIPRYVFAQNDELLTNIESVIARAQRRILLSLDHDAFTSVGAPQVFLAPANRQDPHIQIPAADVQLELRGIIYLDPVNGESHLVRRDLNYCAELWGYNAIGFPKAYSYLSQRDIRVFPAPMTAAEQYILVINQPPLLISATLERNILTDDYPRLLECACFLEGAIFMRDQEAIALHRTDYEHALIEATAQVGRRKRDETELRPRETTNAQGG